MERCVRRELRPGDSYEAVRIWTRPEHPSGSKPADVVVEWRQPHGPTTYALLGGDTSIGPTRFDLDELGEVFRSSRFGLDDTARFGLPAEYRLAVLRGCPTGARISVAAHKPAGSSPVAFAIAARLLATFLSDGIPDDDGEVLRLEAAVRQQIYSPEFSKTLVSRDIHRR